MATNAGFNPPSDPPCSTDVITAAAAVALRNAGGLDVRCHYFVQGPTIGTPGNTSATVVELHAVTASSFSKEAKVQQTFNPEGAFIGSYDLDADTANGGTLNELLDHWGNQLTDEDAGNSASHTIHNQWPYHLSGPLLRDNIADDTDLPGLAAYVTAGGEFRDNELRESSVDLTGVTSPGPAPASFFRRNIVNGGTLTLNVPTVYINNNNINNATVSHLGTAAASFSFQNNTMLTGSVSVDAATTSQVTINNNVIGGISGGYRTAIQGKTGAGVIISGNRLFSVGPGAQELLVAGSSTTVNVTSNVITAGTLSLAGAGGSIVITANTFANHTITRDPAATNPWNINQSEIIGATVQSTANATGTTLMTVYGGSRITNGFVMQQDGTGRLEISGSHLHGHGPAAVDIVQQGGAQVAILDSELTPLANAPIILNQAAIGNISISKARVVNALGTAFQRDAGATGTMTFSDVQLSGARFRQTATNTGNMLVQQARGESSQVTHNGAGAFSMGAGVQLSGAGVTLSAASTRGLSLSGGRYNGAQVTQNRTGGTGVDAFQDALISGQASVTLNGAADPGGAQSLLNRVDIKGSSVVTITDPVGATGTGVVLQNSDLVNATITMPAGALLATAMRFHRCVVNTGAFAHDGTIVDGPYATAFTASNNNRLANAGFSNIL